MYVYIYVCMRIYIYMYVYHCMYIYTIIFEYIYTYTPAHARSGVLCVRIFRLEFAHTCLSVFVRLCNVCVTTTGMCTQSKMTFNELPVESVNYKRHTSSQRVVSSEAIKMGGNTMSLFNEDT